MDHTTRLPATPPWRSAALIAVTVAVIELCVLVALGVVLFGKFFAGEVAKASDPVTVARAAVERDTPAAAAGGDGKAAVLARGETSVLVLNGNGVAGAAGTMAERVRAKHYVVAGTGDASRTTFARSLVMYRPGFEREGQRLARDLGVRRVGPLDGLRPRALQGAHAVVVVGG
ncbi:MAG TPA: LytR C-terminal domain-containing protein [Gaiellaceae bacterium]|nr:LytR C-terminal domain-containing protein [Gaiellaceae bacterium]